MLVVYFKQRFNMCKCTNLVKIQIKKKDLFHTMRYSLLGPESGDNGLQIIIK